MVSGLRKYFQGKVINMLLITGKLNGSVKINGGLENVDYKKFILN